MCITPNIFRNRHYLRGFIFLKVFKNMFFFCCRKIVAEYETTIAQMIGEFH